jgi:2-oxoglutarate ferredoxin oxidoreductase subunit alpha
MSESWAATGKTPDREYNIVTSLALEAEVQEKHNIKLQAKYKKAKENEVLFEELNCEDADYIFVAFGSAARISEKAMQLARDKGIKVGIIRPITLWPFPTKIIQSYAGKVKGFLSVEFNAGQMIEDIRLAVEGKTAVKHYGRMGGIIPSPDEVLNALEQKLIGG